MHKSRTSKELFETALTLRQCANAWEPDKKVLGDVTAEKLEAMVGDYARLRLINGISNENVSSPPIESEQIIAAREIMTQAFAEDDSFYEAYAAQVAMLVHDQYGITDHDVRNKLAEDIIYILFHR